jgi:hypothetical protein
MPSEQTPSESVGSPVLSPWHARRIAEVVRRTVEGSPDAEKDRFHIANHVGVVLGDALDLLLPHLEPLANRARRFEDDEDIGQLVSWLDCASEVFRIAAQAASRLTPAHQWLEGVADDVSEPF